MNNAEMIEVIVDPSCPTRREIRESWIFELLKKAGLCKRRYRDIFNIIELSDSLNAQEHKGLLVVISPETAKKYNLAAGPLPKDKVIFFEEYYSFE